jgi:sulfide:quinone oxidoreductase
MAAGSAANPVKVVVAGGGVGALETVLALRALAGDRVGLELVAPEAEFVHRPIAVAEPFEVATPERLPLARLYATHGVHHRRDHLVGVDAADRHVRLAGGDRIPYDVLVIATGARAVPWLDGALTFRGPSDVPAYRELLGALAAGTVSEILFAAPAGATWTLPLYELALLTTAWIADHGVVGARLMLATPDPEPLSAFGATASRTVRDLLSDRGVELIAGHPIAGDADSGFDLRRLGRRHPDRVVTLPRLVGQPPAGVPSDPDGFIPVDDHTAVRGLHDVYAVGDIAARPIKHGGLAALQADAAAAAIAARAGADVRPEPFTPVLRGVLITGLTSAFLRRGGSQPPRVRYATSWTTEVKTAAPHLGAYLSSERETSRHQLAAQG